MEGTKRSLVVEAELVHVVVAGVADEGIAHKCNVDDEGAWWLRTMSVGCFDCCGCCGGSCCS